MFEGFIAQIVQNIPATVFEANIAKKISFRSLSFYLPLLSEKCYKGATIGEISHKIYFVFQFQ